MTRTSVSLLSEGGGPYIHMLCQVSFSLDCARSEGCISWWVPLASTFQAKAQTQCPRGAYQILEVPPLAHGDPNILPSFPDPKLIVPESGKADSLLFALEPDLMSR